MTERVENALIQLRLPVPMPTDPAAQKPVTPVGRVSPWVKLFVFLHLVAITSWSLPQAGNPNEDLTVRWHNPIPHLRQPFLALNDLAMTAHDAGRAISDGSLIYNDKFVKTSPLKFYTLATGFWQYWDMFSPNPASIDFYGTATVTFRDGTTKLYQYPRMYEESIPKKYVTERYRKFYERAHTEQARYLWPIFAQRVALLDFTDPNNPPVQVVLTRHWFTIAPPGQPEQQDYNSYNYYTYTVDQNRLEKDKAGGIFG